MTYVKTTWTNGTAPSISDAALNKIEDGIYDAHELIADLIPLPIGGMIFWPQRVVPDDYAKADGSAIARTAALLAGLTDTQTGTLTGGSAIVTGLTDTAEFRAGMAVEGTGVPAAATILSIDSGTQVTLSANATATGPNTLRFFFHGAGDGSTTLNLPDARRRVLVGA
jgi:hypothetical protein